MQTEQFPTGEYIKRTEIMASNSIPQRGTWLWSTIGYRQHKPCTVLSKSGISRSERKFQGTVALKTITQNDRQLNRVARGERGATVIEYALLSSVLCFAAVGVFGSYASTARPFELVGTELYWANDGGGTEGIVICPPGVPAYVCRDRTEGGGGED